MMIMIVYEMHVFLDLVIVFHLFRSNPRRLPKPTNKQQQRYAKCSNSEINTPCVALEEADEG